jgi:hypothetical protein
MNQDDENDQSNAMNRWQVFHPNNCRSEKAVIGSGMFLNK